MLHTAQCKAINYPSELASYLRIDAVKKMIFDYLVHTDTEGSANFCNNNASNLNFLHDKYCKFFFATSNWLLL